MRVYKNSVAYHIIAIVIAYSKTVQTVSQRVVCPRAHSGGLCDTNVFMSSEILLLKICIDT